MHWTAFLAYRRFPAQARVIEDCACVQCGYNLRMQMVAARCPECGYEVGNSVFLLAKPAVASRGLRTAGCTYLALLAVPLVMLFGATWSFFVASLIASSASVFRLIGVSDLRFNAALTRLPVIGSRLLAWWIIVIIELIISCAWLATMLLTSGNRNLWNSGLAPRLILMSVAAWLMVSVIGSLIAGRFGLALMDMLNYVWTRIEFRLQQCFAIGMLIVTPTVTLTLWFAVQSGWTAAMLSLLHVVLLCGLLGATSITLLHAATACDESTENWDDLIDSDRIAVVPESQQPKAREKPPIPVQGA